MIAEKGGRLSKAHSTEQAEVSVGACVCVCVSGVGGGAQPVLGSC